MDAGNDGKDSVLGRLTHAQAGLTLLLGVSHVKRVILHMLRRILHVLSLNLHVLRCNLHVPRCILHALRCVLHVFKSRLHVLGSILHVLRGVLHVLRGVLHVLRLARHIRSWSSHAPIFITKSARGVYRSGIQRGTGTQSLTTPYPQRASLGPAHVVAVAGVDFDEFAFFDEEGDVDDFAGH